MPKLKTRREFRSRRHKRVRNKIVGTSERPRLCVFRSNNNIYASLIDDTVGKTLFSLSTLNSELKVKLNSSTGNVESAKAVGQMLAQQAVDKGISDVVFDRGGYLYHGRVKALAEGAREGGLKF